MRAYLDTTISRVNIVSSRLLWITSLDDINTNVFDARIDLLLQECWWRVMDIEYLLRILCCQCGCCSHCIAAVSCYDFLVCFQATEYLLTFLQGRAV